ncbi:hypothetical protein F4805DRAFT_461263 [Annulohypoxylon moriforme]|nr:hypothetical protein F4805DRAFT_461263 [Annulohypoxylon moriforme]
MASTHQGIINLDDEQHPHFELTKLNGESPFFKVLPIEVRLMIYEYALYIDREIRPNQLQEHSNKFAYERIGRQFLSTAWLSNYTLSLTCRAIYAELERWNPFYRINVFCFDYQRDCHTFLSAITPQRRRGIREIYFRINGWDLSRYQETTFDENLLSLLSHWDNLSARRFVVFVYLHQQGNKSMNDARDVMSLLLTQIRDPVRLPGQYRLWDLPFSRIKFVLADPFCSDLGISILREAILREHYKLRLNTPRDGPQWFKAMAENSQLQEAAVLAARVHFPGEMRVSLDKASSSMGPVASRTRAKCKAPDSKGIIERVIPRYNEEGYLNLSYGVRINDIRWNGTNVQCEVVSVQNEDERAWEDLLVLLQPQFEDGLWRFYRGQMSEHGRWITGLDRLRAVPHPRHIFSTASEFLTSEDFASKRQEKYLIRRWNDLVAAWDGCLNRFEPV